ncbi:hypothetical protein B566_EDAN018070, partial [Ephemera danica]
VGHSQKNTEKPVAAWVVTYQGGPIVTAHCTCKGGVSEACSHVGAILFKAWVAHVSSLAVIELSCTSIKSQWNIPRLDTVPYLPLRLIDHRTPKRKMEELLCNTDEPLRSIRHVEYIDPSPVTDVPPLTAEEIDNAYRQVNTANPTSSSFPSPLTMFYDDQFMNLNFSQLIEQCKTVYANFKVTVEQVINVEKATRTQYKCNMWYAQRAGRITGSKMKAACHSEPTSPALSLVQSVCYPSKFKFTTKATKHGCDHEKTAIDKYIKDQVESGAHESDFTAYECGFYISKDYPYIGATPDLIVECSCHGKGVIEVKCPYCIKDDAIISLAQKKGSYIKLCHNADGSASYILDDKHSYMYQIQVELLVVPDAKYAHLVIYTNKEM